MLYKRGSDTPPRYGNQDCRVRGFSDNGTARIVSNAFAGLARVRQHQLVYAALKGQMGGALHALALETSAPSDKG